MPRFQPSQETKNLVFLSIRTGIPVSILLDEPDEVIQTYFICLGEINEAQKKKP